MAAQYITHVTRAGERWDSLAWRYYGDPTMYAPIIAANFGLVPATPVFPDGLVVGVPILVVSTINESDLPPWEQR